MKKTLMMVISGIVVLIAVAALFVFLQLDSIVKAAIEKYGSAITGTSVTVSKVAISPTSGQGGVSNIRISNPSGFQSPYAFAMPFTSVTVDVKSLTSDVIVIEEIIMDSPEIVYEVSKSGNNYNVIRDNVNRYLSEGSDKAESGEAANKQIMIKDFYMKNGKVKVIAPMLGSQSFEVQIPTIHLTDVGRNGSKGNLPQVMQQVMTVITSTVVSAVGNVTIQNFMKFVPNAAGQVVEGATGVAAGASEGVLEGAGDAVEGIGEGIGNIFGGGNKK